MQTALFVIIIVYLIGFLFLLFLFDKTKEKIEVLEADLRHFEEESDQTRKLVYRLIGKNKGGD